MVAYTYDAWGNPLTTTGTMADTLGKLNPFRYRGYVYDAETGLYYLGSRYYNPQWGRFVNADSVVDTEDLLGGNLFAYCGNSPVARRDTTGQFWDTVFDIVSLCISVKNVISNPKSGSAWLGLAADVLCLAIPGLTGGGSAVRAAKTVKNAVAVAKKADNVSDATRLARAASKIGDANKFGGCVSDASKIANSALSTGRTTVTTTTNIAKKGWTVGDDITALTKAGNTPSWSTVRQRFWKNEAMLHPDAFDGQINRMQKGLAPIGPDGFSVELHHPYGRSGDNFFIFAPVTRTEHRLIHYGG